MEEEIIVLSSHLGTDTGRHQHCVDREQVNAGRAQRHTLMVAWVPALCG